MFDTKSIDEVIDAQLAGGDGQSKTAAAKKPASAGTTKTAAALQKEAAAKEAKDSYARGSLMGKGFVDYVLKTAANIGKTAETTNMSDGGNQEDGGSKVNEPGSMMTDVGNKLPTSKDNVGPNKTDESKSVKHLTEDDLDHSPPNVSKAEARIEKAMK